MNIEWNATVIRSHLSRFQLNVEVILHLFSFVLIRSVIGYKL